MDDGSEHCIRHQSFCKPVIDFNLEEDGSLWVLLDADWLPQGNQTMEEGETSNYDCVQVRRWASDNVPTLSFLIVPATDSAILNSSVQPIHLH